MGCSPMDKQFKFCYRICICKGRTKLEELSLERGLRSEIVSSGKSIGAFN